MNLVLTAPTWLLILLVLVLAAAAAEDAWRLRISNVTCLGVVILALIGAGVEGISANMWQNVAVFIVLLALGTFAFAFGVLGGGDVKLLAALGLWTNFQGAVWLVTAVFIGGGILAVLFIAARAIPGTRGGKKRHERRIPYGLAIAAGALISFAASRVEQARHVQSYVPIGIRPAR
jgi:prepilin peptidase CpaA